MSNKLSQFWQELKRRRVVHVITLYASSAFVILELVSNLTEPLNLPSSLPTIVIIVLAVGFPLAVILSWIYDLTGKGIERTHPIDELLEEQTTRVPNAWKIATYMSFVVIIGLATMNIAGSSGRLRSGDIQSILILPFKNYTGDDQLDMVIAGIHSSLIGNVGRITDLTVISPITSDRYSDTEMTLPEIAEKVGVDAVVVPVVTCLGDSMCFEFQLITPDEKLRWFGEYHEAKDQILTLQNRITKQIANEVKIELTPDEERLLAESRSVDPDAVDAYMRGRYFLDQISPQSLPLSIVNFQQAAEIEPGWDAPYAGIAEAYGYMSTIGMGSPSDNFNRMLEYLEKANELDPNSVESHYTNAIVAAWGEFEWEKAEKEFLKALEMNPSHVRSHSFYAHLLAIERRTDEALYQGKLSVELDPENPFTIGLYFAVLGYSGGTCEEICYYLEKAFSIDPDHYFLRGAMIHCYECSGDYENAFEEWKKNNISVWERYGVTELLEKTFHEKGWMAFIEELTRINEEVMEIDPLRLPLLLAERYLKLGKYDKAVEYMQTHFENDPYNVGLPYFSCKLTYDKLKDYPAYLSLLKKINLPVE